MRYVTNLFAASMIGLIAVIGVVGATTSQADGTGSDVVMSANWHCC